MTELEVLQKYFGHQSFRGEQNRIIGHILQRTDVLAIMPTGAGKSICYQIPAILFPGITIVISPLISLMKDQVRSLKEAGIPAAYLNSSLTTSQYFEALRRASLGWYKIIYVAPERLETESFINFAKSADISLVAVDEAHCVSQWGQDFRPGYLKIPEFIEALPKRPVVSAFTATATRDVKADIQKLLRLQSPFEITTGFDRQNLYFEVQHPKSKALALLDMLKNDVQGSGIIYCSTRKTVEEVCDLLCRNHYSATRYHAGLEQEERQQNQTDFAYDRKQIMVATNAFGMGIDKSNVSYVIHYNMPKNIEAYYQEAGRAGRDGSPAKCYLLYNGADVRTQLFLIDHGDPNPDLDEETQDFLRERDRERLRQMTFYCTTTECNRHFLLHYFGDSAPLQCGNCGNCLGDVETVDATSHAQTIVHCIQALPYPLGRTRITEILRGSRNAHIQKSGFTSMNAFGMLSEYSEQYVRLLLDQLIQEHYIYVDNGEYPTLQLSENARYIMDGQDRILLSVPKVKKKEISNEPEPDTPVDQALLAHLKALRFRIANARNVPAYVIFTDSTLREMAAHKPSTPDDFIHIPGVGSQKQLMYQNPFLHLINRYTDGDCDMNVVISESYSLYRRK